ncbi:MULTISPECIES: DUF4142 domain-containing protein [Bradyrhizobium]|uniref:DUF4142 domain-containing protein n=1 Tax=Bradyrhizobium TaxID=374 RepID=UPI001FCE59A5|nr:MULTISPECIES: DUF4142 domain-containing protein [Bradyrhizobium]
MFATHMIADHQKDIAEYKKASKSKDAAGEYASGQIDTLQKHLETAKSLKAGNTPGLRRRDRGNKYLPERRAEDPGGPCTQK